MDFDLEHVKCPICRETVSQRDAKLVTIMKRIGGRMSRLIQWRCNACASGSK